MPLLTPPSKAPIAETVLFVLEVSLVLCLIWAVIHSTQPKEKSKPKSVTLEAEITLDVSK